MVYSTGLLLVGPRSRPRSPMEPDQRNLQEEMMGRYDDKGVLHGDPMAFRYVCQDRSPSWRPELVPLEAKCIKNTIQTRQ